MLMPEVEDKSEDVVVMVSEMEDEGAEMESV